MWQVELLEGNRGIVVLWVEPPKTFLKTVPFALAINVTNALVSYRIGLEKHARLLHHIA